MERHRTIAAAPVRSASQAWQVVSKLLADTLEKSPSILAGSVARELTPLDGLGPALIAGGHLESKGLVLVDRGLHVTIFVATSDAALEVEENLNPVPGGVGATVGWVLYVPSAGPLEAAVAAATKKSPHLSADTPPTSAPETVKNASAESPIDIEALRKLGVKR